MSQSLLSETPETAEARGDLVVRGIAELVTNDRSRGGLLGIVRDAAMVARGGRIEWCGEAAELPAALGELPEIDAGGRAVIPGFVDAHTHVVFGGHRAGEFARRLDGEGYESILAAGGGIHATVAATRAAAFQRTAAQRPLTTAMPMAGGDPAPQRDPGPDGAGPSSRSLQFGATDPPRALLEQSLARVRRMLAYGTTTLEVKSGYGLDAATERRMLEVARELPSHTGVDVVTTFLGAHALPLAFAENRELFLDQVEHEMLPVCAPLAHFCDVFCDRGAFSAAEARRVLAAGVRHGLKPKLHANQLGPTGGAQLAAELNAVSADHLDHLDAADISALRASGTIAVLLPGVALSMRTPQPPGRRLWQEGVPVALATDCNPGTSYIESMQLVVALACLEMGLTPAQAVWSATTGGARALELADRGWLGVGALADFVILDGDSHVHLTYRPGTNLAWRVVKRGRVVAS